MHADAAVLKDWTAPDAMQAEQKICLRAVRAESENKRTMLREGSASWQMVLGGVRNSLRP